MTIDEIKVGDRLRWNKIVSNYGHTYNFEVYVLKVGKKRVTVEYSGGYRASVTPERLHPLARVHA